MENIEKILRFIEEAEGLKSVTRYAWTKDGRRESTAEHSWRMTLFTALAAAEDPSIDWKKAVLMSLIHDMGELYDGDISAATKPDESVKYTQELRAIENLASLLPADQGMMFRNLWMEYTDGSTKEARLVKALDKAETILQHSQGQNPADFDYAFNLKYGKEYFDSGSGLTRLRELLDEKTQNRSAEFSKE
ncbi:HD domain-containing protein [Diplocloster modestus]|nr:HD domain-containing protein [Diplocloster modestus]